MSTSPVSASTDVPAGGSPSQLLLETLREAMTPVDLGAGRTLFEHGDEASSLFVVESGSLKISRAASSTRRQIVALAGPGDLVGEMSLLDGTPRDGTVTAVTPSRLLELPQDRFDSWLEEHPEGSALLLRLLATRLRRSNDVMADLVFADVPSRVARLILRLAEQVGRGPAEDGSVLIEHRLTQEELAQFVGAARETVNKALASFVSRGWIEVQQRSITLRDRVALEALTI